jgi:hypothetical protein
MACLMCPPRLAYVPARRPLVIDKLEHIIEPQSLDLGWPFHTRQILTYVDGDRRRMAEFRYECVFSALVAEPRRSSQSIHYD